MRFPEILVQASPLTSNAASHIAEAAIKVVFIFYATQDSFNEELYRTMVRSVNIGMNLPDNNRDTPR